MKRSIIFSSVAAIILLGGTAALNATPLGTAFTYQGLLKQNGLPVTGMCDFKFSLWDAATAGTQVGPTLAFDGAGGNPSPIAVTNGVFTAALDFGASAFMGEKRWLKIEARFPAGSGAYQTLNPRQDVVNAPNALYARTVPWTGISGIPPGFADGIDNEGGPPTVHWSDILGIPAGFADGIDDDCYLCLPYAGSANTVNPAFAVTNNGNGESIRGVGTIHGLTNSTAPGNAAVFGESPNNSGVSYGVRGTAMSGSPDTAGVHGHALATTGQIYGVFGVTNSADPFNAAGVEGRAVASTGKVYGVEGRTASSTDQAAGVLGLARSASGATNGVRGVTFSTSTGASGVSGVANNGVGQIFGVTGTTDSITDVAAGVAGEATAASGRSYGVQGSTNSATDFAAGVFGRARAATGVTSGVEGRAASSTAYAAGVAGIAENGSGQVFGVYGLTISGSNDAAGVEGRAGTVTNNGIGAGRTFGVFGSTNSDGNDAAGVKGEAGEHEGLVFGVEGTTNSNTDQTAGVRGQALDMTGMTFGVRGETQSNTNDAAGVSGLASRLNGRIYGIAGETHSATDDSAGVRGTADSMTGNIFGVLGSTQSSGPGAAGVKGIALFNNPNPQAPELAKGVWGVAEAPQRAVGVQGDAKFRASEVNSLNARIGVRGYAGQYSGEATMRVGVEGDVTSIVPEPFVPSGVRGVNRGSISAYGYAGVIGQAFPDSGAGPDPSLANMGHIGVWGVSHSGIQNSAGVLGDSTVTQPGSVYGVWGRSKSIFSNASGVKAEGNGCGDHIVDNSGPCMPFGPRAAALEIHNGAIRVSGDNKPSGTWDAGVASWTPLLSYGEDNPIACQCDYNLGTYLPHCHRIGCFVEFPVDNCLIVEGGLGVGSMILLTVEGAGNSAFAQVVSKTCGHATLRLTLMGHPGGCRDAGECGAAGVKVHYLIINN